MNANLATRTLVNQMKDRFMTRITIKNENAIAADDGENKEKGDKKNAAFKNTDCNGCCDVPAW